MSYRTLYVTVAQVGVAKLNRALPASSETCQTIENICNQIKKIEMIKMSDQDPASCQFFHPVCDIKFADIRVQLESLCVLNLRHKELTRQGAECQGPDGDHETVPKLPFFLWKI